MGGYVYSANLNSPARFVECL